MTGFSQPERRGLERLQATDAHPDADLLAAFSEQTLTGRERELVLAHLAACPSCRDVLSLAAPPMAESLSLQPAPKPAFWKWPVLRWGAAVASAVIVVIAVSLDLYERRAQQLAQFGSETAPISTAPLREQKILRDQEILRQLPASPGVKAPQIRYEKVAPKPTTSAGTPRNSVDNKDLKKESNAPAGAVGGVVAGSGLTANGFVPRFDRLQTADKRSPGTGTAAMTPAPATAPPPPPSARLQARSVPAPSETINVTTENVTIESQASAGKQAPLVGVPINVSRAKAARSEVATRGDVAPAFASDRQLSRNVISEWQVSPEGFLLSSTDQGRNWARQLPDQRFTHVQTIGTHVWASGPDSLLMHSIDAGANWTRITPSDGDAKLQGNIVSMVFLDVNHGTLKTSNGETWSTADAGQTWKKQ